MAQPGRHQHQGGVSIGECAHDFGSAPGLLEQALHRIIGPDLQPVLRRIGIVRQGLVDRILYEFCGRPELHGLQHGCHLSHHQALINRVEQEANRGTRLFNIIFHGIGGDYLTVSTQAHEQLLAYLAGKKETYWVDSYIRIMTHMIDGKERNQLSISQIQSP